MPTGYTERIKDGISFRNFALCCAKAFRPLIHMRDLPFDTEVPQVIKSSSFYADKLSDEKIILKKLEAMSIEEIKNSTELSYKKNFSIYLKTINDKAELKEKHLKMIEQVNEWEPPTSDHERYKTFMLEQLESGITHDCSIMYLSEPQLKDPDVWLKEQIKISKENIEYYTEENNKALKHAKYNTNWVQKLFGSLPEK